MMNTASRDLTPAYRTPLVWPEKAPALPVCKDAEAFLLWAEANVAPLIEAPTRERLNQAKVIVSDQFFERARQVSRQHRRSSPRGPNGHRCLFDIWDECYERIRAAELRLAPPKFEKPVTKKERVVPNGIFIPGFE